MRGVNHNIEPITHYYWNKKNGAIENYYYYSWNNTSYNICSVKIHKDNGKL